MINLDKGAKISLDKEFPGITQLMIGLGWFPPGYVSKRFRKETSMKPQTPQNTKEKGGLLSRMGDWLKGDARIGDVVNAGVDSVSSLFDDNSVTSDMRNYFDNQSIDVDASIVFLSNGKILDKDRDLICFHHISAYNGAVKHMGDNLTGIADNMEGDKEQIFIDLAKIPDYLDEAYVLVNIYRAQDRKQHFGKINGAFVRLADPRNIDNDLVFTNLSGGEYDGCEGMYAARIYRYNGEWRYQPKGEAVKHASYIEDLLKRFK